MQRSGEWVGRAASVGIAANKDVYFTYECVVSYFYNFSGFIAFCASSGRHAAAMDINSKCGLLWAGWVTYNDNTAFASLTYCSFGWENV